MTTVLNAGNMMMRLLSTDWWQFDCWEIWRENKCRSSNTRHYVDRLTTIRVSSNMTTTKSVDESATIPDVDEFDDHSNHQQSDNSFQRRQVWRWNECGATTSRYYCRQIDDSSIVEKYDDETNADLPIAVALLTDRWHCHCRAILRQRQMSTNQQQRRMSTITTITVIINKVTTIFNADTYDDLKKCRSTTSRPSCQHIHDTAECWQLWWEKLCQPLVDEWSTHSQQLPCVYLKSDQQPEQKGPKQQYTRKPEQRKQSHTNTQPKTDSNLS